MSFLREVHEKRKNLADVLGDEEYSGIREFVEKLYPDRAHFIYELLQNAEDVQATEASFELHAGGLIFRHNGCAFSKDDVWGITNIGKGSKRQEADKIGRFGVGFKSVFAYSETPLIWSSTYSFRITGLVLPEEITHIPELNGQTQFEFPFNNPKKAPTAAYDEIRTGLDELAETTLLFLTNLESISWRVADAASGVLRIRHADDHVEVLKETGGTTTQSCHFLKFSAPVEGLEKQNVALAFELEFLPQVSQFASNLPIAKQMRIKPASQGRVAVFFPAAKETSGLRFHLHAPFVPDVSRASIKDTPENEPLFAQLAELAASSLHKIRDQGLLTRAFLGVLPNGSDQIPVCYQGVRQAMVEEMKAWPLTPVHGGNAHAAASTMLQARTGLKDLLTGEDLAFFHGTKMHWAVSPTQKNSNVDRFLQQLDIREWDTAELLEAMYDIAPDSDLFGPGEDYCDADGLHNWLSGKSMEWHQQFYAVLWQLDGQEGSYEAYVPIIRLASGDYDYGENCFFPDEAQSDSDPMPRVDARVYKSGDNEKQQKDARLFLDDMGVREVDERERVEFVLNQRYTDEAENPDETTYLEDLKRFIALCEREPDCERLFKIYCIFECEDDKWRTPSQVYLDEPFLDTGLGDYYAAQVDKADMFALGAVYRECGIPPDRLSGFASAVGARTTLMPVCNGISGHPRSSTLYADWSQYDTRRTYTAIDLDWSIPGLSDALKQNSERISLLVWKTMCAAETKVLKAQFRPNQQYETREEPSSLVLQLQDAHWIPQGEGRFVRPSKADRDLLPDGFAFDPGWPWLKAIKFGTEIAERSEAQRQQRAAAKELGFEDHDSLERARQFTRMPEEEQERILAEYEERQTFELPDQEPANPDRRAERVSAMAVEAPQRRTEVRDRSVSVGLDTVKEQAKPYLIEQYTNPDGEMICQACGEPLPFKLDDGTPYFEKVEFLRELARHHHQNYLALCPNHAAMFRHANGSCDNLKEMVIHADANELEIILARKPTRVHFTRTHLLDLRTIILADNETRGSEGTDEK